jgi:hypothetical protein
LDLSHCKSIESLPTTIGDFKHLTKLDLQGCENLKELPQTMEASPHYQYWTYLIASALNHYQQQLLT